MFQITASPTLSQLSLSCYPPTPSLPTAAAPPHRISVAREWLALSEDPGGVARCHGLKEGRSHADPRQVLWPWECAEVVSLRVGLWRFLYRNSPCGLFVVARSDAMNIFGLCVIFLLVGNFDLLCRLLTLKLCLHGFRCHQVCELETVFHVSVLLSSTTRYNVFTASRLSFSIYSYPSIFFSLNIFVLFYFVIQLTHNWFLRQRLRWVLRYTQWRGIHREPLSLRQELAELHHPLLSSSSSSSFSSLSSSSFSSFFQFFSFSSSSSHHNYHHRWHPTNVSAESLACTQSVLLQLLSTMS